MGDNISEEHAAPIFGIYFQSSSEHWEPQILYNSSYVFIWQVESKTGSVSKYRYWVLTKRKDTPREISDTAM
jgi:hypothetical protein